MAARKRNVREGDQATWDVIVIGSGMGGMAAGAALAHMGKRVLLLEQHQVLGGLTHSFSRNGFSWDVGIHYMSGFAPGDHMRDLLDWLCDSPIEFEPMGAIYDVLHIADAPPLQLSRPFEAQVLDLKDRFPDEHAAIDAWFEAVHKGRETIYTVFQARGMPGPIGDALKWWHRRALDRWCYRTTAEVAAEITDNAELKAALCAQWGDHGGRPSKASFAAHALIAHDYLESGAWYPIGGASVIADSIVPTITKAGGEARAGVRVERLLMDDGRVVGVETDDGERLFADVVASDVGARETVDKLLPEGHGADDWVAEIRALPPSICHYSLHLGFEGDIVGAGATRANHWLYPEVDTDVVWTDAPDSKPPCIVAAFASLKDPAHDPGPRQQQSGEIMVWTDWSTVERWAATVPGERGDDYDEFKRAAEASILARFREYFPDLADLIVYSELATPLSTVAYTGHRRGAFYGLDVTPARFRSDALRAGTPVDGLYLTGQDVASPGVPGALWGGLICAGSIAPKVFAKIRN